MLPGLLAALSGPAAAVTVPNTVRVSASPSFCFVGGYYTFSWEVKLNSTTPTGSITDTALYIDDAPHGPASFEYWMYDARVTGSTADGRNFTASAPAPATPARLYVIVMANVSGMTVYNTTEWAVDVVAEPKVTLAAPALLIPGETALMQVKVEWNGTQPLQLVTAHYDMVSHAPVTTYTAYPNATPPQAGTGRSFGVSVPVPNVEATLYVVGRVRVGSRDFYSPESALPISTGPVVTAVSFDPSGVALALQDVRVTFRVAYGGGAVTAFFRFDTTSHSAQGADASMYPRASTSVSSSGGNVTVTFEAPGQAGTLYGVVGLLAGGRSYTGTSELTMQVLERPTMSFTNLPGSFVAGQPAALSWRINFTGDTALIQGSELLISPFPVGTTPSPSVRIESGAPDGARTTWSAVVPGQTFEGTVYLGVRATVNGEVVYLAPEATVPVAKAPAFLPGAGALLALAAMGACAVVAGLHRRRSA